MLNPSIAAAAATALPPAGAAHARLSHRLAAAVPHSVLALLMRGAMAAIFFQSGRTKVSGWLTLTPGTIELFRDEYRIPVLPPELAAHAAAYAEHLFPLLLVLGLGTRLSAAALLGMTIVIEVFVYPEAWPTHLSWACLLLYLIGRGGGALSLDRALSRQPRPRSPGAGF